MPTGVTKADDAAWEDTHARVSASNVVESWKFSVVVFGTQPKLTPALALLTMKSTLVWQVSAEFSAYGTYIVLVVRYNSTRIEQDPVLDAGAIARLFDVWARTPIAAKSNRRTSRLIFKSRDTHLLSMYSKMRQNEKQKYWTTQIIHFRSRRE